MMMLNKFILPLMIMIILYVTMKTHVMNNLIVLEYIVIMVIISMFIMLKTLNFENHLVFYFIVLMITESIVGLSMMINMIRTHGNDFLKSSSIMKF